MSNDVGYGKPPKAHQFRKGRTGNPRGKRRGEENLISVFKRHVLRLVTIRDGDRIIRLPLGELVIRQNLSAAIHKKPLAIDNIYRMAEASGEFVDLTDVKQVGGQVAMPIRSKNMTEFLAEFGRSPETE